MWWSPNRGVKVFRASDRQCWKHGYETDDAHQCEFFTGPNSTEVNVPQHTSKGTMEVWNQNPVDGVEILIVTYRKDFPWLEYALRLIRKHAPGFQGVTVAVPTQDRAMAAQVIDRVDIIARLVDYPEPEGKGFLNHEAMMARADELVPAGTRYVFHMDADCMMKMPNDVRHYFLNDKPIYIYRTWESLISTDPRDPTQKVVSDCMMWKAPTEEQIGYISNQYTMCRHPTVFPIEFYRKYREHIEGVHRTSFMQYMLSGLHNSHPQDRMDYTAMGQVAYTFMKDHFEWINCHNADYPADRMKAYHSHSGFNPQVTSEIESFLA